MSNTATTHTTRYQYYEISTFSTSVIQALFPPSNPTVIDESSSRLKRIPDLVDFIAHALYRTRLAESIVYSSLLLLTRLKQLYPSARGTPSSPHRLFLSSLILASKMSMDDTYTNKTWVIVGQHLFELEEVNRMERELFGFLNSNVYITKDELEEWCEEWCDESVIEDQEEEEEEELRVVEREEEEMISEVESLTSSSSHRSDSPMTTSSSSSTNTTPPQSPSITTTSVSQSLHKILNSKTTLTC